MPSIRRNYIYNLFYQILTLLLPIITTPYLSRVLGAEKIGDYSFTSSIVNYFLLFANFGIGLYGQREVASFRNNNEKRSEVFWNILFFRGITVLLSMICYLFVILYWKEYRILFLIQFISIFSVLFDFTWFFQGEENFKIIVTRNIIVKFITIILMFIFVRQKSDINIYVLIRVAGDFFGYVFLVPAVISNVGRFDFQKIHSLQVLKPACLLLIPQIAIRMYTILDKTMIGLIAHSSYQNGCYEQAETIDRFLLALITSLSTVVIPRISALYSENKNEDIKKILILSCKYVLMISLPMIVGLICVSEYFVPFFFGAGYDYVIPLLKIFTGLFLAVGINNSIGMQYLIPTKKENIFTISVLIGAFTNIVMNFILIPKYGAVGAAIGSVAAESLIAVYQLVYVRKVLNFITFLFSCWKYFLSAFFMAIVIFGIKSLVDLNNVSQMILLIITGVISYSVVLVILKDEILLSSIKSVYSRFKEKNNMI